MSLFLPSKNPRFGRRIILLDQVSSTNDTLKESALAGAEEGTVVVAREQLSGRGRNRRAWLSPRDAGLYCSLLLRPVLLPSQSGLLSILLSLAAIRAIRRATGIRAGLKWPNDLMVRGGKAGGILVESHLSGQHLAFAVAGLGINVNQLQEDFPDNLRLNSTSLRMCADRLLDKDELLLHLLRQMNLLYPELGNPRMRRKWINAWQQHCVHMDKPVVIRRGDEQITGRFKGISSWGAALVEGEKGEIQHCEFGDFSLRENG